MKEPINLTPLGDICVAQISDLPVAVAWGVAAAPLPIGVIRLDRPRFGVAAQSIVKFGVLRIEIDVYPVRP